MSGLVALLTDFGYEDGFTGALKGVIKSINPNVDIIDITHGIQSFDILKGAVVLRSVYRYFPKKTIFVCVVDPGVGSERKAVLVETENYFFVAPDNGILSLALREEVITGIFELKNERFFLKRETETFHGRDIFAPVAGHLSKGVSPQEFGNALKEIKEIDFPQPVETPEGTVGQIIMFDKFGNGITNIAEIGDYKEIFIKNYRVKKICRNFMEGEENSLNLIKGSFGFYEVFVPQKSAKEIFNLSVGDKLIIKG